MRTLLALVVVALLVFGLAASSVARVSAIQTRAALADQSEASITDAVNAAVDLAILSALAMGLPRLQLNRAELLDDTVLVEILAADDDADNEGPQRGAGDGIHPCARPRP